MDKSSSEKGKIAVIYDLNVLPLESPTDYEAMHFTFIICLSKFAESTAAVFRLCSFDKCSLFLLITTHQMACAACGLCSLGTLKQRKGAAWFKWKPWQVLPSAIVHLVFLPAGTRQITLHHAAWMVQTTFLLNQLLAVVRYIPPSTHQT